MRTNAALYDHDFYAWVQEQATWLKARQERHRKARVRSIVVAA